MLGAVSRSFTDVGRTFFRSFAGTPSPPDLDSKEDTAQVAVSKIIHLTKVNPSRTLLLYEAKSHFFLGLAAEAEARSCLRISRFMLASNFLVGTL